MVLHRREAMEHVRDGGVSPACLHQWTERNISSVAGGRRIRIGTRTDNVGTAKLSCLCFVATGNQPRQGSLDELAGRSLELPELHLSFPQWTVHGVPNWSPSMPKRIVQSVSWKGICTAPFCDRLLKIPSASAASSILILSMTETPCGL